MNIAYLFNAFEIALWSGIGSYFLYHFFTKRNRHSLIAAITFGAFAASDAVELRTGAWWRPWWLFAWKAACVVILLAIAVQQHRSKTENPTD